MTWPDRITVYHKLRADPPASATSFALDVVVLSERHRRPAARIAEDIVVYDYRAGRKRALPPFMLAAFQETWRLQEESGLKWRTRAQALLARVRALERRTWDKEGAEEVVGSG